MPIMNGFVFLEECKKTGCLQGQDTKVIVVTSFRHQDDVLRAKEYEIAAYLNKPVSEELILSAVQATWN
jgi:CheY-like chemotaxis protein